MLDPKQFTELRTHTESSLFELRLKATLRTDKLMIFFRRITCFNCFLPLFAFFQNSVVKFALKVYLFQC